MITERCDCIYCTSCLEGGGGNYVRDLCFGMACGGIV